nr:flippase [Geothrix paludis]
MAWTLLGYVLPMAAAIVIIPLLIHRLGPERFGLLTFVWMIVGYSTLLDLGIGRALTQSIAERLGSGEPEDIPAIVQTGVLLLLCVGLGGAAILIAGGGWISNHFLKVSPSVIQDAHHCLTMAAAAVPLVILGTALRGVLEAYQRFKEVSLARSAVGILLYLSPLPVLAFSQGVWAIVGMLVAVRLLELGVYAIQCYRLVPGLFGRLSLDKAFLKPIFSFGLWSTANNLIGTLMTMAYIDRLYISAMLGTAALVVFATPFDMVVRVLILPTSIVGVLFPAFSSLRSEPERVSRLAVTALNAMAYVTVPLFMALMLLAKPMLTFWLGSDLSSQSALIFQLIALGMVPISIGYVPFAFIQAMGRPDLTTKRHLWEIPFYLLGSYLAVKAFGTRGTAMVWCAWALIDLGLILRIMSRMLTIRGQAGSASKWTGIACFLAVALAGGVSNQTWIHFLGGLVLPTAFVLWGWRFLLADEERKMLGDRLPDRLKARLLPRGHLS